MVRYRFQDRYISAGVVLSDLEQLDAESNNNKETILISKQSPSPTKSIPPNPVSEIDRETRIINNQFNTNNTSDIKSNSHPQVGLGNITNPSQSENPHSNQNKSKSKFKAIALVISLLALIAAAVGSWLFFKDKSSEPEPELSLYENSSQGFKINYPEMWLPRNRDDFFATGVIFVSPLENDTDNFKEKVSVLVENLSSEISLAQYTDESIAEIKKLSDPSVGDALESTLGDNEARQVIYRGEENGKSVQRMQTWSVKDNQAYVITYTAQPDNYDNYLPTVEKMLTSFEIYRN